MSADPRQELELRRRLQAGGLPAREELEVRRQLAQMSQALPTGDGTANTSPMPLPARYQQRLASMSGQGSYGLIDQPSRARAETLAEAGVDVSAGAPVTRIPSGFAQNQALEAQDLQRRLSEQFGQPVQMRLGQTSGGLEYLNPQTNRWTTVNRPGFDTGDLGASIGTLTTAIPAVAGEVIGSPLGLIGAVGGAALGGATGEAARRVIGNLMGLREETPQEVAAGALSAGAIEGAAAGVGEVAARTVQGVRNLVRPMPISADRAEQAIHAAASAQAVADEISRRTEQRFQPFTGQTSGDVELLAGQTRVLSDPQSARQAREQSLGNEDALETLFRQIMPGGETDNAAIGRGVQAEARARNRARVDLLGNQVQGQLDELRVMTDTLPRAQPGAIGEQIRTMAAELRENFDGYERDAWRTAEGMYGLNPDTALSTVRVPVTDDLELTINRLRAEAREALDPATASGKSQLATERLLPTADNVTDEDRELLQAFNAMTPDEQHSLDLHQVQVLLQSLRRRERLAYRNEVAGDPEARDLSRLTDALVIQRNRYLRETNPDLLAQIELAEDLSRNRANMFDRGVVGGLLRRGEGGEYVITDPEVVGRTLASGNPDAVRRLVEVFSHHPAGIATLQNSLLALYRKEAVIDGIPRADLHRRFMENHGSVIDELLPQYRNTPRQLGEFERVVTSEIEKFEDFKKQIERGFRGRISDLAPERIVEDIFTKQFTINDVQRLMRLAESSGYRDMFQQAVGNRLQSRFISSTSGIQFKSLSRYVRENSDKLSAIFGEQYVVDMNLLLRGLETARKSAGGIATGRNPTLLEGFARATVARQLSAPGVVLTRAQRWQEWAGRRLMAEAVMNPDILHTIVRQRRRDLFSRDVSRLLAVAGASTLAAQQEEQE